jgi:outer membrane immunogenic protein
MRSFVFAVSAFAAFAPVAASAADLGVRPVKAPVAVLAPAYDWTGFYIGGHAGYGWADSRYNFNTAGHYNFVAGDSFTHSLDGFMGGGHIGFNWQWSNIVLGLEGSWTYSDVRGNAISPFFPATDTFDTRVNWVATITPRLGVTTGPWLFYVKGGAAFADIRTDIRDTADFNRRDETKVGWTVGGGVEWMFANNWVIGVEGNYYDFGRCCDGLTESLIIGTNTPAGVFSDHDTRVDMWSVMGRISYKFGGGPVVARY